jgi:predicted Na+-dependent transporter
VVFIVSSLLDMGLRLDPRDAARGLRNVRFVGLTLFWGFVASPALAIAITSRIGRSDRMRAGTMTGRH